MEDHNSGRRIVIAQRTEEQDNEKDLIRRCSCSSQPPPLLKAAATTSPAAPALALALQEARIMSTKRQRLLLLLGSSLLLVAVAAAAAMAAFAGYSHPLDLSYSTSSRKLLSYFFSSPKSNKHHHQQQHQHYLPPTTTTTTTTTGSTTGISRQQQEQHGRRLLMEASSSAAADTGQQQQRILYIVTTLAEYNTGSRNTIRGSDRLQQTLIPVLVEGVTSMVNAGYHVDVFLVCHFTLLPERQTLIRQALPHNVGLNVWNDATPLGYDTSKEFTKIHNRTLHLARQHRFVIKDQLLNYDIFVNFEDDMVIKDTHVQHFVDVTNELKRLEELAPEEILQANKKDTYHGTMTKGMLRRMIPGFMRVEVLLDESNYPAQSQPLKVPVHNDITTSSVDADICCSVSDETHVGPHRPAKPQSDQLMIWETNILPLGVRQMPKDSWLDWVVMQRGPNQNSLPTNQVIQDYWSNTNGDYFGTKQRRPGGQEFKYINNQGGWMATREQLLRWHWEICPGGFLPPYEAPHYNYDGLDMRNVEWYSGGMQLSTVRHACNMQRIILLDPKNFSKSLIYHSANNKQRQLTGKREEMFSKANTLLGQLHTIKSRAEQDILQDK